MFGLTGGADDTIGPVGNQIPAPFDAYRDVVRAGWIDENGHMNMGYYVVVFDYATDAWLDFIGLDTEFKAANQVTTFSLESHVTYRRELREGDELRFTTRLLGFDEKRIHYFHEMSHAREGYLAATNELMSLHVSEKTRRSAPMAPEILERLAGIAEAHRSLPVPPQVGRVMGLKAAPTT
jgi:acyl-CoA thioester hydrolase